MKIWLKNSRMNEELRRKNAEFLAEFLKEEFIGLEPCHGVGCTIDRWRLR